MGGGVLRIANLYSHLNGYEFLLVHKANLWQELENAIKSIDASQYVKISKAKPTEGRKFYDQKLINKCFEEKLLPLDWKSVTTPYYVTGDIETEREIVSIRDRMEQKRLIESKGFIAYSTNNQVDFVKDRVAVEVQFGKYFSVAYDLHVKHTFFYLRNDIDVGIEIIPTKAMSVKMDTGVPWFENEVANVIREGRSNPTVPIVMVGIEPDTITL